VGELKGVLALFNDPNSFLLFVLLFVPGFVSVKAYMLHVPTTEKKTSDMVIDIVVFSLFNDVVWYVALALLTAARVLPSRVSDYSLTAMILLPIAALLVTPVLWTVAYISLRNALTRTGLVMGAQPTAWDKVFTRKDKVRIVARMSDGRLIGGIWENPSYASGYPADPQLYLPKVWTVGSDGATLLAEVKGSKGVLLFGKDIVSIELYEYVQPAPVSVPLGPS
jgi:hypothetical protein